MAISRPNSIGVLVELATPVKNYIPKMVDNSASCPLNS